MPVAFEGSVGAYENVDLDILRTTVGEGFTGWVAEHRTPLCVPDVLADPRGMTIPGTDDVDESMVVVPMLYDDVLVGVITLSKLGLHQFDEEDVRLLSILADQAATAFTSASHLAEAQPPRARAASAAGDEQRPLAARSTRTPWRTCWRSISRAPLARSGPGQRLGRRP